MILELKINNKSQSLSINNIKFIFGENNLIKYEVFNEIRYQFNGFLHTEYSIDVKNKTALTIDGKPLDLKKWRLLEINHVADFQSELKISTKSLLYQFLETHLMDIEYNPLLTTVNTLLGDLSVEIFENCIESFEDIEITPKFVELTSKQLIKLIELDFIQKEHRSNLFDLSYNDLMILQCKMIIEISRKNPTKNFLMLIDIPILPKELLDLIESNSIKNLYILVNLYHPIIVDCKKVLNVDRKVIDFADEIAVYNEIMMSIECGVQFEEINELLNSYIAGNRTDYVEKLKKIL